MTDAAPAPAPVGAKKYPAKPQTSHMLQRRLSKGGNQYFDSGDYNMQGGNPVAGTASPLGPAGRPPMQSKLASEAVLAVTPGAGRLPVRRKSQPSKLGGSQASPTSPKPQSPMAASADGEQ